METFKYIVPGDPIAELKVVDASAPRIWDEYKHKRFNFEQYLRNQHDQKPLFIDPLIIKATFYFKPPIALRPGYHDKTPNLHSLYNFVDYVLKGVIYRKDCQIFETVLKKLYSQNARTEITIKRVK